MPDLDIVTFDCYGTLIDWESGIASAIGSEASRAGVVLERRAILAAYAETEPVVQSERYRSYRNVLTETSARLAALLGFRIAADRAAFLADSVAGWLPFPDTNPSLERLSAAGIRLGILSNIDDDLLAATRRHFTVPFDLIITAEQVGSYKPAAGHFTTARERIGNAHWLHAAESNFHDIVPTHAMGVSNAWINRNGQQALAGGTPGEEFRDLTGLADWLT